MSELADGRAAQPQRPPRLVDRMGTRGCCARTLARTRARYYAIIHPTRTELSSAREPTHLDGVRELF